MSSSIILLVARKGYTYYPGGILSICRRTMSGTPHIEDLGNDRYRAHACGLQSDPLQDDPDYRLRSANSLGRVYEKVA